MVKSHLQRTRLRSLMNLIRKSMLNRQLWCVDKRVFYPILVRSSLSSKVLHDYVSGPNTITPTLRSPIVGLIWILLTRSIGRVNPSIHLLRDFTSYDEVVDLSPTELRIILRDMRTTLTFSSVNCIRKIET